ncbi:MAG: hypothetical protein QOH73_1095 [Gaiellaceae bacterium]|nr:hypothetical protein [Gaiellaceae bacterium]
MAKLSSLLRNPFSFLFAGSQKETRLVEYVLREHGRGRSLAEILEDPFIRNRATDAQRARLMDNPDVIRALGADTRT